MTTRWKRRKRLTLPQRRDDFVRIRCYMVLVHSTAECEDRECKTLLNQLVLKVPIRNVYPIIWSWLNSNRGVHYPSHARRMRRFLTEER